MLKKVNRLILILGLLLTNCHLCLAVETKYKGLKIYINDNYSKDYIDLRKNNDQFIYVDIGSYLIIDSLVGGLRQGNPYIEEVLFYNRGAIYLHPTPYLLNLKGLKKVEFRKFEFRRFDYLVNCDSLKRLELNDCSFDNIDDNLCKMPNLRHFIISNSNVSIFPKVIKSSKYIRILAISNSEIKKIPQWLTHLDNLVLLYVDDNRINSVSVRKLKALNARFIALGGNPVYKKVENKNIKNANGLKKIYKYL